MFSAFQDFPYRPNNITECEFYLLENLDCCLVVFQPYRPLVQFCQDLGAEESVLPVAWRMVNDSLRTDVSLLYPPYQVKKFALRLPNCSKFSEFRIRIIWGSIPIKFEHFSNISIITMFEYEYSLDGSHISTSKQYLGFK